MPATKADIIAQLQKELLFLQGFKPVVSGSRIDLGLGPIKYAFPHATFPLGAVHEFICNGPVNTASTAGFIAGIMSSLMHKEGVSLWISRLQKIFPPALLSFGIAPDKIIFITLQKDKDILWAMEEALKCEGLAAVVGELQDMSFTASRRLQLAVEQSRVTGFILRTHPGRINTNACITRWQITALPSLQEEELPGVGFPRWNVELLKVRNGKPGSWQVEWSSGRFKHINLVASLPQEQQKNTG